MANIHLPKMGRYTNMLSVQNGGVYENDYVIIMSKSHGGIRFAYVMVDPFTQTLTPKLNLIIWARLVDIIDFATCVFRNCLYVIGGREKSSGKLCREVQKYDPHVGRWKQCEDLGRPRARHAAAAIWGKIYVFGGMVSRSEITDSCESYEPLIDEWHSEEPMPEPRKDHACVATENDVYVIGGASETQVANDNVWVLSRQVVDPGRTDHVHYEWKTLSDPKQPTMGYRLSRPTVAICRNKLYILGGVCHGQTSDGKSFIRSSPPPRQLAVSPAAQLVHTLHARQSFTTSDYSGTTESSRDDLEIKWHIGTSQVIESYNIMSAIPNFDIDDDLEEANRKQREEELKKRKKNEMRQRQRMRNKRGRDLQKEKEEEMKILKEEEEKRKAEEEERERRSNMTFWKTGLPDMPEARSAAGAVVLGNKLYVIGGRSVDDETRSIRTVEYFHTKKKQWFNSFTISEGELSDVDCCVLSVPHTNKDFKPMKYSGCKWVMW